MASQQKLEISGVPIFNGKDYENYSKKIMQILQINKLACIVLGDKTLPALLTAVQGGATVADAEARNRKRDKWYDNNVQAIGLLSKTCTNSVLSRWFNAGPPVVPMSSAEIWTHLGAMYAQKDMISIAEDLSALFNLTFNERDPALQIAKFWYHYERIHGNAHVAITDKLAAFMVLDRFPSKFSDKRVFILSTNLIADAGFTLDHVLNQLQQAYNALQVRIVVNSRTSTRTLDVKDDHADKLSAVKHAPQNPPRFAPQRSFPPRQNPLGDSSRGSFKKRNCCPYSQKQKQEYAAAKAQNSTEHSETINMIVEDFDLTPVVSPEDDYTMINLTTYPDDNVITLHPVATPETNSAPSAAQFLPLQSRIADLSPRGIMYHYDHLAPTPPASPSVYPSFNAGKSLLERMAVPISMESLRSAELSSISQGFSDNADISPLIFAEPDQLPELFDPEEGMTLDEPYSAPTPEYIPTEALTSSSNPAPDEPLSGELQEDKKVPLEARHGRHVDGYPYNYLLDNWPINTRSKEDALLELKYSTKEEWKIKSLNIKDLDYFITYDSNDDDSEPDDDGDVMDYRQDYREQQIAEVVMRIIKRRFYNADVDYHIPDKKLKIKEIMEYIADQVTARSK
ncbi:hypothetical protein CPB83DRAFT_835709 [Crepidotus variabilis]|uniref:Uncharacterized protein n=1 Tax=Crepidotus variabilis TaxID=179855 RepID=A0A9P6JQM6_9AGAR|nr:hypothetical protein CPB83DRAFT_835709 [Crepidotus variabilis]